jgi:hypothetical protein
MRFCRFASLFFRFALVLICGSAFSQATRSGSAPHRGVARVPFVGCASDGQIGPVAAPAGQSKSFAISAEDANRLAYYTAQYGFGVLAPRGWHCFSTYGSNGSNLYVTPHPIDMKALSSSDWKGLTGEAIQVSVANGGTSGRLTVARAIARVFPKYKEFAQDVIAEGIEPATDFPFGPYPQDKLRYTGNTVVEFETPAQTSGLGTDSQLQQNGDPIRGVAMLVGDDPDLVQLSIRMSAPDLIPVIVKSFENGMAPTESASKPAN